MVSGTTSLPSLPTDNPARQNPQLHSSVMQIPTPPLVSSPETGPPSGSSHPLSFPVDLEGALGKRGLIIGVQVSLWGSNVGESQEALEFSCVERDSGYHDFRRSMLHQPDVTVQNKPALIQ